MKLNKYNKNKEKKVQPDILEVDIEYPKNFHYENSENSDYPLAPENINMQKEWLSDYYLEIEMNVILL